jgi:AcrR family transcriptional regulator
MAKEEMILDAAIKIFSEKGFSAATTSEIAKEAGVAEGTIFRYFKTKKELLKKVMAKLMMVFAQEFVTVRIGKLIKENKDKSEREFLIALFKDRLDIIVKNWDIIKIVFTEVQFHEDLRSILIQNFVVKGKELISEFYEDRVARGIFRNYDSTLVLRSFVGILGMYMIQRQVAPELLVMDEDKQIEMMVDMVLYGISNNGGAKNG